MAILLPICKLLKRKRRKYNQWEPKEDTGCGRAAGEEKGEKRRSMLQRSPGSTVPLLLTVYSV